MEAYTGVLQSCPLFSGIEAADLPGMLACLDAHTRHAGRDETIFLEGEPARRVGVVLSGAVQVVRTDYDGMRNIVSHLGAGALFGESFACAGVEHLPVSVVAAEESTLLMLDCQRIITTCSNACRFHSRLVLNLLRVVAAKNLAFNRRLEIAAKRTTREKLMAYLLMEAKRSGSSRFTIPYDRQALADFLGVDRSGLSTEIGKLQREGRITCHRRSFTLLRSEETAPDVSI